MVRSGGHRLGRAPPTGRTAAISDRSQLRKAAIFGSAKRRRNPSRTHGSRSGGLELQPRAEESGLERNLVVEIAAGRRRSPAADAARRRVAALRRLAVAAAGRRAFAAAAVEHGELAAEAAEDDLG